VALGCLSHPRGPPHQPCRSVLRHQLFGPNHLHHLRAQHASIATAIEQDKTIQQRARLTDQLADIDQRIGRLLAAIEAGIEPALVGERIRTLKAERHQAEAALSQLDLQQRQHAGIDLQHACAILDELPTSPSRSPQPTPSFNAASSRYST
jgi:hypothetical protein